MVNLRLPQALAAMKPRMAAEQPSISIQALATYAVEDHIRTNGCEFEPDAATRAVKMSGIAPDIAADNVSHDDLMRLGDLLEDMETNCPHKTSVQRCIGMNGSIIASPDGRVQYSIGERVGTQCDYPYAERVISGYEDGSWNPNDHYDHSAWFVFEDGHKARPFVLIKLGGDNGRGPIPEKVPPAEKVQGQPDEAGS